MTEKKKISLCLHLWLFMQITFIRELAPLCLHKALKKLEMQDIRGLQLRAIIIFIIVLDLKHLQSLTSKFNIYPTSGIPIKEPRCMMCQETYEGAMKNITGYIVYDMYFNA